MTVRNRRAASRRPAGSVEKSKIASLAIRIRSRRDTERLEQQVQAIYALPLAERRYLSRAELAENYGARADDLDAIKKFAHEHGLVVSRHSARARTIMLTGRIGGRRGPVQIPGPFADIIASTFGFNARRPQKAQAHRYASAPKGPGPGGDYGISPVDIARHYNFPTRYRGQKLDGAGQCIGIIQLGGGFDRNELRQYFREIGLRLPHIDVVSVNGGGNHPGNMDADVEPMIDLEIAGAVAPRARIVVYCGPDSEDSSLFDALKTAIHDSENNPGVITTSWGGDEDALSLHRIRQYHELFLEAVALGITVCAASGDHGTAGNCDVTEWRRRHHLYHPATDDLVLACGGTQIREGKEVVWNDGLPFDTGTKDIFGGWASTGGISDLVKLPDYQKSARVPKSMFTGKRGRGVPDIAMLAENYFLRWHNLERHTDLMNGGTSCVAPLMAALVARLNQAKKKNVGFLNRFLYENASKGIVKDVRHGNNGIYKTIKGYKARRGWDACTGLGTPDGTAILNRL